MPEKPPAGHVADVSRATGPAGAKKVVSLYICVIGVWLAIVSDWRERDQAAHMEPGIRPAVRGASSGFRRWEGEEAVRDRRAASANMAFTCSVSLVRGRAWSKRARSGIDRITSRDAELVGEAEKDVPRKSPPSVAQ